MHIDRCVIVQVHERGHVVATCKRDSERLPDRNSFGCVQTGVQRRESHASHAPYSIHPALQLIALFASLFTRSYSTLHYTPGRVVPLVLPFSACSFLFFLDILQRYSTTFWCVLRLIYTLRLLLPHRGHTDKSGRFSLRRKELCSLYEPASPLWARISAVFGLFEQAFVVLELG